MAVKNILEKRKMLELKRTYSWPIRKKYNIGVNAIAPLAALTESLVKKDDMEFIDQHIVC